MAGGNLALDSATDTLRIYIDANANGARDAGENTELLPAGIVTPRAKTDLDLVAVHRPNWGSVYGTNERYGRRFAPAGITLQEVGRMRMTSYAIRTRLGAAEEVAGKEALLEKMRVPSPESIYNTQAIWNQDKPDNPRLVRNARRKTSQKRGGGVRRVELDVAELASEQQCERLIALDEALDRFAQIDPAKADLVKLRYFARLTIREAADALGISTATADRYWAYARAWLQRETHLDDESAAH